MDNSQNNQQVESQFDNEQVTPQIPHHNKRKLLLIGTFLAFCVLVSYSLMTNSDTSSTLPSNLTKSNTSNVSPTPVPFAEMTIPHLRNRTYKSELNALQLISEGSTYTTYVTSYTSDGLTINGLLTQPTGDTPDGGWPAIVFVHGYIPPTEYRTLEKYTDYIDFLARNGFVVFKIDLRGHGDSEGEPGGGYYSSDYIIDTLNARAALQASDFVNPEKIGLWGHSMAGNVTLRSMAAQPDIPATVIWAGAVYSYVDQQKYGIDDNSYRPPQTSTQRQNRRRELFEKHGTPSAQSTFWQQVAPIYYLDDLKGAVQLHHAVDDDVVNVGYSRDLNELLDQTSVPHSFYEYQSGGHNISGSSFVEAMQHTVTFFEEHLKE